MGFPGGDPKVDRRAVRGQRLAPDAIVEHLVVTAALQAVFNVVQVAVGISYTAILQQRTAHRVFLFLFICSEFQRRRFPDLQLAGGGGFMLRWRQFVAGLGKPEIDLLGPVFFLLGRGGQVAKKQQFKLEPARLIRVRRFWLPPRHSWQHDAGEQQ